MTRPSHATHPEVAERVDTSVRKASPLGLLVALIGVALFNIAPFLDWYNLEDTPGSSTNGYQADSLIPFVAYLGAGLVLALLYAFTRADRRQHRGLSLVTMAVGLAAVAQVVASLIDVPGLQEPADALSVDIGLWLALAGASLWALGAGLLSKEPEGDVETPQVVDLTAAQRPTTDRRDDVLASGTATDIRGDRTVTDGTTDARDDRAVTGTATDGTTDVRGDQTVTDGSGTSSTRSQR